MRRKSFFREKLDQLYTIAFVFVLAAVGFFWLGYSRGSDSDSRVEVQQVNRASDASQSNTLYQIEDSNYFIYQDNNNRWQGRLNKTAR